MLHSLPEHSYLQYYDNLIQKSLFSPDKNINISLQSFIFKQPDKYNSTNYSPTNAKKVLDKI